jgi:hypothetical protein
MGERKMSSRRLVFLLVLSAVIGVIVFFLVPKPLPELSPRELISEVASGHVQEVIVVDAEIVTGVSSSRGPFRVVLPRGDTSLIQELRARGVMVKFESTPPGLI